MRYHIRQLGLGGILDQAISLLRDHFGLLFGIVAMTIVPVELILGMLTLESGDPQTAVMINGFGHMLVALLLYPAVNGAVIYAVANAYLSRRTSIGACMSHGFSRLLPLLGTSILMGLAIMGGLILLIIPGILFALWFMLAQQVTVLEGTAGSAALTRSKVLMQGNVGTGFVLGLIIGLINFGLGMAAGVIPQPHAQIIAVAVIQGIATLLATCAFVVFYFSCRCKVENFDLQVLADAVGAEASSAAEET